MQKIVIGVCTGRSGSVSMTRIVEDIFRHNLHASPVYHERDSHALYRLYAAHAETGSEEHLEAARNLIRNWEPGSATIGNGCQQFLPEIVKIHGAENIKLIVIKREEEACLDSLIYLLETLIPNYTLHYDIESEDESQREKLFQWYTAVHFGEMSKTEWHDLSLREKLRWYYHKTYALIDAARPLFDSILDLQTEKLSDPQTLEDITNFIEPSWKTPPYTTRHLNSNCVDFSHFTSLTDKQLRDMNRFYTHFDFYNAAFNPFEGSLFFWKQIYSLIMEMPPEQSENVIIYYQNVLNERFRVLESLKKPKA